MSYPRGRRRELYICERLRAWGATDVARSPMSRGPADVTAFMPVDGGEPVRFCIQSAMGKYLNYAKALRLIEHSAEHGCVPIFVKGAARKPMVWMRLTGNREDWLVFTEPSEVMS